MPALFARLTQRPSPPSPSSATRPGKASLITEAGTVEIATDEPDGPYVRDRLVAAWTDAVGAPDEAAESPLDALRASSLVAATPHGLELRRGPYGGRSLYYAQQGAEVIVSSRLDALIAALPERPALDVDALAACGVGWVLPDVGATVYRGVKRVGSCEVVRFEHGGRVSSTLRLPAVARCRGGEPLANARAMRELLQAIVASHLRRYASVAVLAGGGVDSSALYALASREALSVPGERVTGLTMDFEGPGDDRPHMEALLRFAGAETLRAAPTDVPHLRPGFFEADAAPHTPATAPVVDVLYARARRWGARAILTGVYGDFVLDGDLGSFAVRARRGDLGAVVDALRLEVPWTATPLQRLSRYVLKPLLRPYVPRAWLARRHARWLRGLDVWRWAGPRLRRLLPSVFAEAPAVSDWRLAYATAGDATDRADGVTQEEEAAGVPIFNVYEDPRFIDFIAELPPEQLFFGHRSRGLFRAAIEGVVPDSLRLRHDKAMMEPMLEQAFQAMGGLEAFKGLLTMEATGDLGLVEPVPFRETFERLVRRRANGRGWQEQWAMLAVEGFVRGLDQRVAASGRA